MIVNLKKSYILNKNVLIFPLLKQNKKGNNEYFRKSHFDIVNDKN